MVTESTTLASQLAIALKRYGRSGPALPVSSANSRVRGPA
jgi:hypothetical protein